MNTLPGRAFFRALWSVLILFSVFHGTAFVWATNAHDNPGADFGKLVQSLKAARAGTPKVELRDSDGNYWVVPHSDRVRALLKSEYGREDWKALKKTLTPATEIILHENGLVKAADRPLNSLDDPTHYDAVWVRDTLWVSLALAADGKKAESLRVLTRMLDYLSTPEQLARFKSVIADPLPMKSASGAMLAVHIRFDRSSRGFRDVQVDGKPQSWNHKQNDALGLCMDLVLRAVQDGSLSEKDLTPAHLQALALLPAYFSSIRYDEMEDAGSWEEIERVNTSSIALVTSALERLSEFQKSAKKADQQFLRRLKEAAGGLGIAETVLGTGLASQLNKGYSRIFRQLQAGGESPLYPRGDARRREADAALLNLIYPASLSRLKVADKEAVLKLIDPLVGEVGIRRYLGDSYQSGNFWFQASAPSSKTEDSSSSEDFAIRGKGFLAGSEAQWFFDSWYSKAAGLLHRQTGNGHYRRLQLRFLNRSLAQLTGGTLSERVPGADGRPVAPFALPESYNTIVVGKDRFFCPSPITPLNWAKASLVIALDDVIIGK